MQRHDQLPAARVHDRTVGRSSLLAELQEVAYLLLFFDQELLIHSQQAVAPLRANMKLEHVFVCQRVPSSKIVWKRLRNIEGGVRRQDFLGRPILRVQIYGERFAGQMLLVRRERDAPKSMPRIFVGLEDDRPVE